MPTANYPNEVIEMNEIDPTTEEIQNDLKSIEEIQVETVAPKRKGLRHQPSMYATKKRKQKLALQKAARKRQRGK